MKAKISKNNKFIQIIPKPKYDIRGGLRVYFFKALLEGCKPSATCDILKGQSRYYFSKNMIGRVVDCDFAETTIKEGKYKI